MEKSRPTHGLTSEPKSPSPKFMNPRTTNLMMDGELSLSTTGILHSLNPPNHKNHRHHHPLTTTHSVKISDNIASPDVYKCPITSSQRISADCTKITDNIASAEMRKHRIG